LETILAFVIGGLFAASLYMLMRRSIVKLVIGLALISYAVNLLIFTVAGLTRAYPPIIPDDAIHLVEPYADPLPQALVLTAIVINFGVLAFAVVLIRRVAEVIQTDDVDDIREETEA
jgi:multicomponent Na+:H+ antiporter subunit C